MLNLSQLLFVSGINKEAIKLLSKSIRSGIDESAQMEAHFYSLSHTSAVPETTFQGVKRLLDRGVRLQWNVRPNIECVRESDSNKAELLEIVSEIMAGERNIALLDEILGRWE